MGWLSILPVFPSQLQVNEFLLEPFFVLFLIFCLYQPVFGKTFCTSLPVLTRPCKYGGFWKYHSSGLLYISDITPSWYGEFSSKSVLMSWSNALMSKSVSFLGITCNGISAGLGGACKLDQHTLEFPFWYPACLFFLLF